MDVVSVAQPQLAEQAALDVNEVHRAHGAFVWATLQRLGGRPNDLDDLYQETLLVVHRRGGSYDPAAPLRPWLYGVCVRVVAGWRRRAHVRREEPRAAVPEAAVGSTPEDEAARRDAQEILLACLDEMDLERRAVFVMFEIDELPCDHIAEMIGVPVGTVYSRLHAARDEFRRIAARWQRRNAGATR